MQGGRNRAPDDLRSKPDPGQTQEAASKGEGRKGKDAGQGLKPKLVQDFLRRPLSFLGGPFHKSLEVQGSMVCALINPLNGICPAHPVELAVLSPNPSTQRPCSSAMTHSVEPYRAPGPIRNALQNVRSLFPYYPFPFQIDRRKVTLYNTNS